MRKVLLGVTGCIAAYKACEILRGLQKAGVDVEVAMTENAAEFVSEMTFSALSGHPVRTSTFGDIADPIPHIRLAEKCDLMLIAPCTGNMVAKLAHGIADDLLSSTALAANGHLAVAPAMNVHMYEAPSTQANLEILRSRGVEVIEPGSGYLACGEVGKGRLAEPEDIVGEVLRILDQWDTKKDLFGKRVLITAGPTVERIDPVRYITNDSSGKMGYSIAEASVRRGAEVILVSGPVALSAPEGVEVISVQSAQEMMDACQKNFENVDIAIFAAAVSDMRPKQPSDHKLKKSSDSDALSCIELVENPDILKTLSGVRQDGQFVIGFAAETDDIVENAKIKLEQKGASMIVANQVGYGIAFGQDDDKAYFIYEDKVIDLPKMSKLELANKILDEACANIS